MIVCPFVFIVLGCAWGHALLALKLDNCPIAAKSRENAEYIFNSSEPDAVEQIFDCYVNTTEELSEVIDRKAVKIEHAYNELAMSGWLAALFVFLIFIKGIST